MKNYLRSCLRGTPLLVIIASVISCNKQHGIKPAPSAVSITFTVGNYMIVNRANPDGCLATGIYAFNNKGMFAFAHGTDCSAIPNETGTYSITNGVLTVTVDGQTEPFLKGSIANVNASGFDYTDAGSSSFPEGLGTTTHFYSLN